jgi:hypothetical protein
LRGDDIIRNAELHLTGIVFGRQESEQTVVDVKDILTMLMAVVQTSRGQLRELTCSVKTLRSQGVRRRGKDAPVCRCRVVGIGTSERRGMIVETLVRALPCIRLLRERVCCVWSAFVVAMDDMNVLKLVARVDLGVLGTTNVGHIAPVVCRCASQRK